MARVLLGVGSNISPEVNFFSGLDGLRVLLTNVQCSPVYESSSVGFVGDNFLNCVIVGQTDCTLQVLNQQLKALELQHGREAGQAKLSSKTLDVDILCYDNCVGEFDGITLPRPEILTAAFVLKPLADLLPSELHPVKGEAYASLWEKFSRPNQTLWQYQRKTDKQTRCG